MHVRIHRVNKVTIDRDEVRGLPGCADHDTITLTFDNEHCNGSKITDTITLFCEPGALANLDNPCSE